MQFRINFRRENGKRDTWVIKIRVFRKVLANNFALSGIGGVADLPLLRTLLVIRQKSREPSFWENINTFVSLAYPSVAASRTMLQRLLTCLNFPLDLKDLFWCWKRKGWFLWTFAAAQAAENQWNISQIITKTAPVSTRIVISYTMKLGIPFRIWQKVNGSWDNNMIRISQWWVGKPMQNKY